MESAEVINTVLVKRRALYEGEIGFFPTSEMAEEDIALANLDEEVVCSFYRPRNLEALKFLWALVHKTAGNTDIWLDRGAAMDDLKKRANYTKILYNNRTRELEAVPKSLKRISDKQLRILTDRIKDIICFEILPGMKRNNRRREIEEMLSARSVK